MKSSLRVIILLFAIFCKHQVHGRPSKRSGIYHNLQRQHLNGLVSSGRSIILLEQASPSGHESDFEHQQSPELQSPSKYKTVYYKYRSSPESTSASSSSASSSPSASGIESATSSRGMKSGFSIGSGLRSIAQGSADQAHSAVANQHAAAKQAAFLAKNTLAQAASQAAATAQAALAGKQVLLQELEQQAAEAQRSLSRELEQLQSAKIASKLADQTAQAAFNHVSVLTAAVNNAKALAEQAEETSKEVSNQLAAQSSMVGQAKSRLQQVEEQLNQARIDYAATKEATVKASASAAEAQVNASKAAAHATIGLHESTINEHSNPSAEGDESYDEEPHIINHLERKSAS